MKLVKEEKSEGITLIALVITIIVLLILAGVSIVMLTGENGILTQAQRAKSETENAQKEEEKILDSYEDYMNGITGGIWDEEKGVNTPALKGNMKLVKWDGSQFVTDETKTSYDYEKNEWANAVVTVDGIESYFVWIPRYEYKITYNTPGDPTGGGTIEVKFIKTSQTEADEGYIIHPAFRDDSENDYANGGWDSELSGIWVGKYETSLVNKETKENIITNDEGTGNILLSNNTDKAIAVQPNMSAWRWCTIGNMYTNAKSYSTNLNSHMLKNSEWGAVAYLTESRYGRNGTEVTQNTNSSYITANGDIVANKDQSSTGNETGIYNLSGGTSEYVAAYFTGGNSTYLNNGSSLVKETEKKYVTAYTGTNVSTDYKTGDATYETKSWHSDNADFVSASYQFFHRGGSCNSSSSSAGVFYYVVNHGDGNSSCSFRVCLAVK